MSDSQIMKLTEHVPEGKIIASYGRHHLLNSNNHDKKLIQCFSKGKKKEIVVGDKVEYLLKSLDQAVITRSFPRFNQFERSNPFKRKIIAANINQIVVVVATEPCLNEVLLNKILIEAEDKGIPSIIVLNKTDITSKLNSSRKYLKKLQDLGYPIVETSTLINQNSPEQADAGQTKFRLLPYLVNKTSLLIGQSGVGKSTLLNILVPEAKAKTQSISKALGTGKHTTSLTKLFKLPNSGAIIDSPGIQEFGLNHIKKERIAYAFKEFREKLGFCRFHNCQHDQEPGCAILHSLSHGEIDLTRYRIYKKIIAEGY